MGVDELKGYLEEIKDSIRNKTYKPELVRRVEIPKPDGGVQNLGVPTVLDRFVQQAIDRKSTRLNSSHITRSRMPSSA